MDAASITFKAAVVADLEAKGPIARRRLACFHALAAAIAPGFIDIVFVVIVVGILFIDLADNPPLEGILGADLSCGNASFVRLTCDIEVGRAELAVAAFVKLVYRLHRRVAQYAGSPA